MISCLLWDILKNALTFVIKIFFESISEPSDFYWMNKKNKRGIFQNMFFFEEHKHYGA